MFPARMQLELPAAFLKRSKSLRVRVFEWGTLSDISHSDHRHHTCNGAGVEEIDRVPGGLNRWRDQGSNLAWHVRQNPSQSPFWTSHTLTTPISHAMVQVFHHLGQLVAGHKYFHNGAEYQASFR